MSEQPRGEEQEVHDLIAGAGPRAAVPAEDVATIKAAARQEWREMVARERRQRRGLRLRGGLALAASVLLALAIGWWWTTRTAPVAAPVVARVELVAGTVRTGGAVELAVGGELMVGASVETAGWVDGTSARVALRLNGGQSLRLAADSRVRLISDRRFELERGTLYVDSDPGAAAGGVEVTTGLGTVRDIGTQFEVRLSEGDAALRVRVREGECTLEAAGDRHPAARGDQLSLLADGSVVRAEIETYGPEWEWVLETAPSIEIDGRSLDTVLSWIARETGRQVRYAEPSLAEASATEIIVSGTADGLTPAQTLDVVVTGSALSYQIDNGTILIGR
jgi:hypothetical protein